ncbi:hypothetical protein ACFFGV_13670 [Pontibacillus salicampi]|uniref:DUF7852 domain-containing protein n=1 Tax=Pontibacillus salicampi TaxID=1449801 RepID=A0ABV6LQC9_9BACI
MSNPWINTEAMHISIDANEHQKEDVQERRTKKSTITLNKMYSCYSYSFEEELLAKKEAEERANQEVMKDTKESIQPLINMETTPAPQEEEYKEEERGVEDSEKDAKPTSPKQTATFFYQPPTSPIPSCIPMNQKITCYSTTPFTLYITLRDFWNPPIAGFQEKDVYIFGINNKEKLFRSHTGYVSPPDCEPMETTFSDYIEIKAPPAYPPPLNRNGVAHVTLLPSSKEQHVNKMVELGVYNVEMVMEWYSLFPTGIGEVKDVRHEIEWINSYFLPTLYAEQSRSYAAVSKGTLIIKGSVKHSLDLTGADENTSFLSHKIIIGILMKFHQDQGLVS